MAKNTKNTKSNNNENDNMSDQDGGAKRKTVAKKAPTKKVAAKAGSKATGKAGQKKVASAKKTTRGSRRETGKERYFKIINPDTGMTTGRYTGDTPKQAASKGYTKLLQKYREKKQQPPKQSTIYLRESTRGSSKKIYGYSAMRQKLNEPQELKIKDKETGVMKTITYHYRNKIKKVAVPEQIGGVKRTSKSKKAGAKKTSRGAVKKANSGSKKGSTGKAGKNTKKATPKKGGAAKKTGRSSNKDE